MEISSIHICLIDDDEIQNFINEKVIQRFIPNTTITKYLNAQLAIEHLKTGSLKPDVILLDINMPIMNGWDFLNVLHKENLEYIGDNKQITIYILSSSKDPSDIEKMKEYPILKGFFHKPLNLTSLQTLLDDRK